ncbi:MAG TPA: L-threonylcarbamoyladenylate synthase [Candidatus Saccharimonadales bacterium]
MKIFTDITERSIAALLQSGHIGVLRTDTLYGIVASIKHPDAVERVYQARNRELTKACIVLIGRQDDIIDPPPTELAATLESYWPGPVSIILPAPHTPDYLTRGGDTLAYRLPADTRLQQLLLAVGPLVAPSANIAGMPPAHTMQEAQAYFGETVDFYVDGGEVSDAQPSQLLEISADGSIRRLR